MDIHKLLNLFHILIVAPLFIYIGLKRDKINNWLYTLIMYLGIIVLLFHSYKVYSKLNGNYWINLIHIFIVAPLLIYIGYNKQNTSRKFYEILLMLGFAVLGYHLYYLIV